MTMMPHARQVDSQLPFSLTFPAPHLRFLSTSSSTPLPTTINTAMTLHRVDEAGSSPGVSDAGFASGAVLFAAAGTLPAFVVVSCLGALGAVVAGRDTVTIFKLGFAK